MTKSSPQLKLSKNYEHIRECIENMLGIKEIDYVLIDEKRISPITAPSAIDEK